MQHISEFMQKYQNIKPESVQSMDAYSEEFLLLFHACLEKFVSDYDDMSQMTAIKQAKDLLETINNQ